MSAKYSHIHIPCTVSWHIISIFNAIILAFNIGCSLETALVSWHHKLRGPLYFSTFFCLLAIGYFIMNPFIDGSFTNNSLYFLKKCTFIFNVDLHV
jgi:hypothetical protein